MSEDRFAYRIALLREKIKDDSVNPLAGDMERGSYMYDEICISAFLEQQLQLFKEQVAETPEEAEEFLEDCMAVVCKNIREVRDYFEEEGADITGMSNADLAEASEVFALPDGRYLIVEG